MWLCVQKSFSRLDNSSSQEPGHRVRHAIRCFFAEEHSIKGEDVLSPKQNMTPGSGSYRSDSFLHSDTRVSVSDRAVPMGKLKKVKLAY